jgi:hypothetical protein
VPGQVKLAAEPLVGGQPALADEDGRDANREDAEEDRGDKGRRVDPEVSPGAQERQPCGH